jgi:hypothetical protein
MDMEAALRAALEASVPGTRVSPCLFHMHQATLRWIHSHAMGGMYQTDAEFRALVRQVLAMPLLPPGEEEGALRDLLAACHARLFVPFSRFIDYFRNTYLAQGYWSPGYWNHYRDSARTNNYIEGFHSKMRGRVGRGAKNLIRVFKAIKKEESANSPLFVKINQGTIRGQRHRMSHYESVNVRLETLWNRYDATQVDRLHFLTAASHLLSQPV